MIFRSKTSMLIPNPTIILTKILFLPWSVFDQNQRKFFNFLNFLQIPVNADCGMRRRRIVCSFYAFYYKLKTKNLLRSIRKAWSWRWLSCWCSIPSSWHETTRPITSSACTWRSHTKYLAVWTLGIGFVKFLWLENLVVPSRRCDTCSQSSTRKS